MVAKKTTYLRKGFSLIEVIIFVAILALFFVTAMAVVTYSLQTMKSNEYKIKASIYAEELMEWIKAQKEIDWTKFTNKAQPDPSLSYYCFNDDIKSRNDFPAVGDCSGATEYSLDSVFRRSAQLTSFDTPVDKVEIHIKVQWNEPGGINSVPLDSYVTIWE